MKARIVQGGIRTCEIQVKRAWYLPWETLYDGMFPWRGSFKDAQKIVNKLKNK